MDSKLESGPYSRLVALEEMGVVADFERIRDYTIAIVGIGGVGAVVAEMLTRCGIGRLILFDRDRVELANMNRLFYRRSQVGLWKTVAAKETLRDINPDVEVLGHCSNISSVDKHKEMIRAFSTGSFGEKAVSLVLCCVDNFEARFAVSRACNDLRIPWMESGVSEDAMSGHVQFVVPGRTACYECAPPLEVVTSAKAPKRGRACSASLPTTMTCIAAFVVQNSLKYLLGFGEMVLKPRPDCGDVNCMRNQSEREEMRESPTLEPKVEILSSIHPENESGIEVVSVGCENPDTVKSTDAKLSKGLSSISTIHGAGDGSTELQPSLEDLMQELGALKE